jgi:NitT/TauT family transport system permease protein
VDVGRLIGLNRLRMMTGLLMPASFPSILTGVKTGWARAWRALISAEMVFGATGVIGGLGWDIYIKRSYLDMPGMFASLIVIMVVGILVEDLFFRKLENVTVRRWGMMR